jgi:hypothetical protein
MAINFLNNVDFNKNQLLNAVIENQPNNTAAGTGSEGQVYYDTTLDVLKIWANGAWTEVGGGVTSFTATDGTFINLTPNTTQGGAATLTADLSATGTPDATKYLRGDNTWSAISGIYDWNLAGDGGTPQNIISGETVSIIGAGVIGTVAGPTNQLTISHADVARSNTTSSASPAFGATFTAVDSVTSSAEGHITGLNLKTITLPTPTPSTITLTGEVTGSGTTSISTTVANNVLDVANFNAAAIVTAAEGIENNNNDTTLPTSAAVKAYVDAAVVGGLIYQGGYDAATNTPNLDSPPTIAGIKKGWTYTVTVDGTFFTEQVRVGDVLIAEIDAPTTLADWTTVQNNIDIASLTQIGIGNVNAGAGIGVSYLNGTATISAAITSSTGQITAGSLTGTVNHAFGINTMVQTYDAATGDTVFCDVTRTTTSVTATIAQTNASNIIILVQRIG